MIDPADLYRTHAADVYRFALFLSGDPTLADDIVAETFVRFWGARERVEQATVRAYLLTIARNLFLQERRGARNRRAELDDRLADPQPSPGRRAEAREDLGVTLAALQELPEGERAALLLRAGREMSYEEIAVALGISSVAAAMALLFTALPLSCVVRKGEITFLVLRDAPVVAAAWWFSAAVLWGAYVVVRSRMRPPHG